MFHTSTDHANDVMVQVQLAVSLNGNGCQNCQCYRKKHIDNMTSKCSKLCSETTRLWLVFPYEFWVLMPFLRSIRVQTMENGCRFV